MPTLSICIPTHDGRAEVLDRLLNNLTDELQHAAYDEVEICVSDNGSQDETQDVLQRHRAHLPVRLVTHRFERNDGFTPNLLKVVDIASNDFCWLIGSDDLIAPGAIAKVLAALEAHPDVAGATLNRYRVNFFDPETKHFDPPDELPEHPEQLHIYRTALDAFSNVGLLQDFLSTALVDRKLFTDVVRSATEAELEEARYFAHLLVIGRMIQRRPCWMWHPEPLVQHTTGTSALDEDLGHNYTAYQLEIMKNRDIAWTMLFGRRSPTYRAVMIKAYRRTARPTAISSLKLMPNHDRHKDVELATALTGYFFWHPPFWIKTMPVLLAPAFILKAMSRFRQAGRAWRSRAGW